MNIATREGALATATSIRPTAIHRVGEPLALSVPARGPQPSPCVRHSALAHRHAGRQLS